MGTVIIEKVNGVKLDKIKIVKWLKLGNKTRKKDRKRWGNIKYLHLL